ncbi:MAG: valine--tRNA ligase, partial [Candidatus Marinimicrobia bacterium]|nr:valine--tRNA ligase [Candidatus Neomarinimicrobiota bacterium]
MSSAQPGKVYEPAQVETRWYAAWQERGYFQPRESSDAPPFTIAIPPPNVTGILHIGHVLNGTIQDVLVRRARMQGRPTLWIPGTDHASIATEAKIVQKLRKEGLTKHDLGRDKYLEEAWAWTEKYGGTIIEQLKRLGCSCDWERTRFTMDDDYYAAVIETFVRLYDEGYIYRGERLINWDPQGRTALSDEEVNHRETQGHLWHFRYPLASGDGHLVVATTRPETMLGDSAVAVHPDDDRYRKWVGQSVILPLVGREIPIVADEFVDPDFGTGAVKVTPAHDFNDNLLGQRHDLDVINIFNPDATLNENAPETYQGLDRFAARKKVVADMEAAGLLEKVEDHLHNVGYSERTDAMVEPYLSLQWFMRMPELAAEALKPVESGEIKFYPDRWVKVYRHWMTNIRDWCISRQLWWGHRIPVWYGPDNEIFVGRNKEEALAKAREHYGRDDVTLEQDPDVLDTWFSSWLWPFATLGWPDAEKPDLARFYPTQDLVTAPEILFFWVARMIMAGQKFMGR